MNDDELNLEQALERAELGDGVGNVDLLYDNESEPKTEPERPALGLVVPEEEPPKVDLNVAATPILAMLRERPTSYQTLCIALRKKVGNGKILDDTLAWLERRGKIERFQNFKNQPAYRLSTGKPSPKAIAAARKAPT